MPKGTQAMNRTVGFVTRVRMSPADVMACIDAVDAVHGRTSGMSLSLAVKRGVEVALETLRANGLVPRRDGFEYREMIEPFGGHPGRAARALRAEAGHRAVIADQQALREDMPRMPALGHRFPEKTPEEIEEMIEEDKRKTREAFGLQHTGGAVAERELPQPIRELPRQHDERPRDARASRTSRTVGRKSAMIREQEWKKRTDPDNWTEEEERELQRLRGGEGGGRRG